MKIWYSNQVDLNGVVIADSSHLDGFPGQNVANDQQSVVWTTGNTLTTEFVSFDFGSSISPTDALIFAHNLQAGDSNIKVQASNASDFSVLTGSTTFTYSAGPMQLGGIAYSGRYWRIIFDKSSSSQSRNIGRVFIGGVYTTTEQPDYNDGFESISNDLSNVNESRGGQEYGLRKNKFRAFTLGWTYLNNTQAMMFDTIFQTTGIVQKFWIQVDESSSQALIGKIWYVRITDFLDFKTPSKDADLTWNVGMKLRTQL